MRNEESPVRTAKKEDELFIEEIVFLNHFDSGVVHFLDVLLSNFSQQRMKRLFSESNGTTEIDQQHGVTLKLTV